MTAAGVALSGLTTYNYAAKFADQKKRVGLIGCGCDGKSDLLRIDPGRAVRGRKCFLCGCGQAYALSEAADIVAERQDCRRKTAHLPRLPRDVEGERFGHCAGRHAGPLAPAGHDCGGRGWGGCVCAETDQRGHHRKVRRCPPRHAKYKRVVQVGTPASQHAASG